MVNDDFAGAEQGSDTEETQKQGELTMDALLRNLNLSEVEQRVVVMDDCGDI
jgi:hypothetical protein